LSRLYAIVDTARDPKLYPLVIRSPVLSCLFAGDIPEPLDRASPYLVELTGDTPLKSAWRDEGWGAAWGLLCRSSLEPDELRRHLRKFLLVQLPDGDTVFFRFYDPRVWQVYWPACNAEERAKWLNGVDEFMAEGSLLPGPSPMGDLSSTGLDITLKIKLDILVGGRPKGQAEIVPGVAFEVGRHGSGCRIEDQALSRRHFVLECVKDRLYLEDLGSANGTYIHGEQVDGRVTLEDGDRIEAGNSAFTVHISTLNRQRIAETGWVASEAPAGWRLVPQLGFQRQESNAGESVSCSDGPLPPGRSLEAYIDGRLSALGGILPDFAAGRLDVLDIGGNQAALALCLVYRYRKEPLCQYQYHIPAAGTVGTVTWTKAGPASPADIAEFKHLIGHLSFDPTPRPGET